MIRMFADFPAGQWWLFIDDVATTVLLGLVVRQGATAVAEMVGACPPAAARQAVRLAAGPGELHRGDVMLAPHSSSSAPGGGT